MFRLVEYDSIGIGCSEVTGGEKLPERDGHEIVRVLKAKTSDAAVIGLEIVVKGRRLICCHSAIYPLF